ncbi:MAG: cytochrome b/b6 domain-containing protein [Sphingomicrobium sp.]
MKRTTDPIDEGVAGGAPSVIVWDLSIRLFHWGLVGLIAFSWWSAENDHVQWHMWSGYAVITLLLFRLLWGIVGGSTARFSSFVRGPRAVAAHLRDPGAWRDAGHNPLGGLSVLALLGVLAAQVGLGLILTDEDGTNQGPLANLVSFDISEAARELHETCFTLLQILILLHVAAIAYYRVFKGKRLVGPMITGRAIVDSEAVPVRPAKWWLALICLAIALAVTRWIVAGAPPFGG